MSELVESSIMEQPKYNAFDQNNQFFNSNEDTFFLDISTAKSNLSNKVKLYSNYFQNERQKLKDEIYLTKIDLQEKYKMLEQIQNRTKHVLATAEKLTFKIKKYERIEKDSNDKIKQSQRLIDSSHKFDESIDKAIQQKNKLIKNIHYIVNEIIEYETKIEHHNYQSFVFQDKIDEFNEKSEKLVDDNHLELTDHCIFSHLAKTQLDRISKRVNIDEYKKSNSDCQNEIDSIMQQNNEKRNLLLHHEIELNSIQSRINEIIESIKEKKEKIESITQLIQKNTIKFNRFRNRRNYFDNQYELKSNQLLKAKQKTIKEIKAIQSENNFSNEIEQKLQFQLNKILKDILYQKVLSQDLQMKFSLMEELKQKEIEQRHKEIDNMTKLLQQLNNSIVFASENKSSHLMQNNIKRTENSAGYEFTRFQGQLLSLDKKLGSLETIYQLHQKVNNALVKKEILMQKIEHLKTEEERLTALIALYFPVNEISDQNWNDLSSVYQLLSQFYFIIKNEKEGWENSLSTETMKEKLSIWNLYCDLFM